MRLQTVKWLRGLFSSGLATLSILSASAFAAGDSGQQAALLLVPTGNPNAASLDQLVSGLANESHLVRQAAVTALMQLGESAVPAVRSLVQALSDQDTRVRWAAATALGRIGKPAGAAEAALVRATRDRDADVQCAAFAALRAIDVQDFETLTTACCDCLTNNVTDVQFESLTSLAFILPHTTDALRQRIALAVAQVLTMPNEDVRLSAAALLGDLDLSAAVSVPLLTRATQDRDDAVRAAALRSLEQFAEAVDQKWNRLTDSERELLRRPCRLASQGLSENPGALANDPRMGRLAAQFQQLSDGIQLASGLRPTAVHVHSTDSNETPIFDLSDEPDVSDLSTLSASSSDKSKSQSTSSPRLWAWGALAILTAVGITFFVRNRATRADTARTQDSSDSLKPETPSTTPTNQTLNTPPPCSTMDSTAESQPCCIKEDKPVNTIQAIQEPSRTPSEEPTLAERRKSINQCSDQLLNATATLNQAITDEDAIIRWRSASAVTAAHSATVPQLLAAVASDDPGIRKMAVSSLRGFGSHIVPQFVAALHDTDDDVRHAAAVNLGQMGLGAIDAIPKLVASLKDTEPRVRAACAFALSTFGPHAMESVPELRQALSDEAPQVRASAAFALGQIGPAARRTIPELVVCMSDDEVAVRRQAASALGGMGTAALPAVQALSLAAIDVDVRLRRNAITAIAMIDSRNHPSILKRALTDVDSIVRQTAYAALSGQLTPDSAVISDEAASGVPSKTLPETAVEISPESSVSNDRSDEEAALIEPSNRDTATLSIDEQPEPKQPEPAPQQTVAELLKSLRHDRSEVRAAAAKQLGQQTSVTRTVLLGLMQALSDHSSDVRCSAAMALGQFGHPAREATVALQISSLTDAAAKVRSAAQAALQQITESLSHAA